MNKNSILGVMLSIAIIVGIGVIVYNINNSSNGKKNPNYDASRTYLNNIDDQTINNIYDEDIPQENKIELEESENIIDLFKPEQTETEISSFTTKIYTKESGRQNNVSLACSTLNDTLVKKGETFSFSNTVGRATTSKGYKKADVFRNGEVVEALGGGLCQVSTTLYNAVLKVSGLKVTERHPHSNRVPYIGKGKDAAVSYGAQDFKFVNNTENTIKIKASNTKNNITISLLKLE